MFRNYLIVAVRNLLKNRLFTAINIFGLALGLASSFLVYIYINYHHSFDSQYKNSSIYRVLTDTYTTDNQFVRQFAFSMHFLAPAVQKAFPVVEESVRLFEYETILVYLNNRIFFNKTVIGADSNIIHFFNFHLRDGNLAGALTDPNTAVITRSMANVLFGKENPIGKTIGLGYGFHEPWQYKITGVIDDLPVNTHMRVDILTSAIGSNSFLGRYTIFDEASEANYYYPMFDTYLKIRPGTDIAAFEQQLNAFLPKRIGKTLENFGPRKLHLQHISDIHFRKHANPDYVGGMERRSLSRANEIDPRTIKWIGYGALILLVFSIFNYVNLTYLNSISRSKEIGMRKIFGAGMVKLFTQFLVESFLLTGCALLVALVLILCLVRPFYSFLELPDSFTLLNNYNVYLFFLVFIIGVVLIQSLVLFLILLSADVTRLQKGDQSASRKAGGLRRVLMAAQLIVSFVLIAGTLLLSKQISYFLNKDLGFDNSNMLVIRKYTMATGLASIDMGYLKSFKNELRKSPYIDNVCLSTITPGFFYNTSQRVWLDQHLTFQANTIYLDPDYRNVYNLKLLAGRFFTDDYKGEANNVVINRKMMNMLKIDNPADVIGHTLYVDEESSNHVAPGAKTIIGVLENFYQEPLSNEIAPIKFHLFDSNRGFYSIRLKKGADTRKAVDYVKGVFAQFYPKDNLDYYFLDDFMKEQYRSDNQIKKIMQIYTSASILVAYLGLLAFSVYLIRVRKRSIAIRKVLGARAPNVLMLLIREYLGMLLVSFVIAIPLTLLVINQLFQNYTYRTNIGWLTFLVAAVILSAVVIGTIARQAVKVTIENPVKALKYE